MMIGKNSVFVHCPVCGSGVAKVRRGKAGYADCPCCANKLGYIIQVNGNVILEINSRSVRRAG